MTLHDANDVAGDGQEPTDTISGDAEDTPWLEPIEMRFWRAFLESSGRALGRICDGVRESAGISFEDFEVLVHLSEAEGSRLRMVELADRCLHSQSRLTQRVDRMTARGLVRREPVPGDGRGTYAVITTAGVRTMERIAPAHLSDVRRWLVDLVEPDELETVTEVLERVAGAARADR